jgi:hypothetical protein
MSETTTRKFGVTSDVTGLAAGLIANSLTFNKTAESAEARNEKGEIIDIAAFSVQETVDVQGVYVGTGVEPGTVVTIGDKSYLVTDSSKTESNTAFQEGSISCRTADNATLHPISEIQGTN